MIMDTLRSGHVNPHSLLKEIKEYEGDPAAFVADLELFLNNVINPKTKHKYGLKLARPQNAQHRKIKHFKEYPTGIKIVYDNKKSIFISQGDNILLIKYDENGRKMKNHGRI